MSQENVEMLRAAYEGSNAGKGFDPELLTTDVEFRQPEIGEADYHGREGVARGIEATACASRMCRLRRTGPPQPSRWAWPCRHRQG
jgi:hypothetical protein